MVKKHHNKAVHHHQHEDDTTYVRIDNALQTRKQVLESAIDITELMKRYESYKVLRELKMKEMKKLEILVKKIRTEMNAYVKNMPKIKEVIEEEKKELKMLHQMEVHKTDRPVVEEKEHLTGIEREIEEIKAKLKQLDI
jgi:hypothetical protein